MDWPPINRCRANAGSFASMNSVLISKCGPVPDVHISGGWGRVAGPTNLPWKMSHNGECFPDDLRIARQWGCHSTKFGACKLFQAIPLDCSGTIQDGGGHAEHVLFLCQIDFADCEEMADCADFFEITVILASRK